MTFLLNCNSVTMRATDKSGALGCRILACSTGHRPKYDALRFHSWVTFLGYVCRDSHSSIWRAHRRQTRRIGTCAEKLLQGFEIP